MEPTEKEIERFAATFQVFAERMAKLAQDERVSPVRALIDAHVGADTSMVPILSETFQPWDHVNVQVAVTAWLGGESRSHEVVGLTGQQRHYSSLSDMLDAGQWMGVRVGPVDLVNLPVGPRETLACVQFGLFLVDDGGARFAVLMRGPSPHAESQGDHPRGPVDGRGAWARVSEGRPRPHRRAERLPRTGHIFRRVADGSLRRRSDRVLRPTRRSAHGFGARARRPRGRRAAGPRGRSAPGTTSRERSAR